MQDHVFRPEGDFGGTLAPLSGERDGLAPDRQAAAFDSGRQKIHRADEAGREAAQRLPIDFVRRADLLDIALVHHADAVGDGESLLLVVGHVDGGDAQPALDVADIFAQLDAKFGVQIGKRLVHQQQGRPDRHGAGKADALLLAAGHLRRIAAVIAVEADHLEALVDPLIDVGLRQRTRFQAKSHILRHRQMRKDCIILENHADITLVSGLVVDSVALDDDFAAILALKSRNCSKQAWSFHIRSDLKA